MQVNRLDIADLADVEKEVEDILNKTYTGFTDRYGKKVYMGDIVSIPDIFDYKCGTREFKHNRAIVVRCGNEYGLSCFEKKGKVEERLRNKEITLKQVLEVGHVVE